MTHRLGDVPFDHYIVAQDSGNPRVRPISIFGVNPDIDTGVGSIETITPAGIIMDMVTTADVVNIVSDNVADVGVAALLTGLDADYNEINEIVVLNGTTPVSTTQDFLRVNSLFTFTGATGVLTASIGGSYVRGLDPFYQRSQDCCYTTPAGYSLFINNLIASAQDNDAATFYLTIQGPTGPKQRLSPIHVNEAAFQIASDGLYVAEKTQVTIEAIGDGIGNNVTAIIGGKLIRNDAGAFEYGA